MTLEESLRQDLELVTRARGLVERIPEKASEPIRDPVSSQPSRLEPESTRYHDFLMGPLIEEGKRGKGALEALSRILSSFRIDQGLSGLEMIHAGIVHPSFWVNTTGHENARRRLLALWEDVAAHLRKRLKRECGPRKKRTGLTSWSDLNVTQQKILRALAAHREPRKGALLVKELDIPEGTAKPYLAALVNAGFLRRTPQGYAFEKLPDGAPELEGPNQAPEPEQPSSNP